MRRVLVLGVALFLLAACGSDSSGPSTEFTGTYEGTTLQTSGGSGSTSITVTVGQAGSNVQGTYSTGAGDRGTITGTFDGQTFQGTMTSLVTPVTCTLQGTLFSNGGVFTGTSSCDNGIGSTLTVTRV